MPTTPLPEHVTVKDLGGGRTEVACTKCQISMDVPPKFGHIPGAVLVDQAVKDHAHAPRKGRRR